MSRLPISSISSAIYQAIFASAIKRSLMWLYNHELIKGATVLRLFDRFQLGNV